MQNIQTMQYKQNAPYTKYTRNGAACISRPPKQSYIRSLTLGDKLYNRLRATKYTTSCMKHILFEGVDACLSRWVLQTLGLEMKVQVFQHWIVLLPKRIATRNRAVGRWSAWLGVSGRSLLIKTHVEGTQTLLPVMSHVRHQGWNQIRVFSDRLMFCSLK